MLANEEEVKALKEGQVKEIRKLREEFQRNADELKEKYEGKHEALQQDLHLQRKMEIHEIEERKNAHINELMDNHERSFSEMRNYYNSITRDNLALIKSLKDELLDLREKATENDKVVVHIQEQNKKLSQPLEQIVEQVKTLQKKLVTYAKDKRSLKNAKARLIVLNDEVAAMVEEIKMLSGENAKVEHERDDLYQSFEAIIKDVNLQKNEKNDLLEKRLSDIQEQFVRKRVQFTEVLKEANLDKVVLNNLTRKLDEVLDAKNVQIKNVKYEIAKVTKAHDDLVRVYESKLSDMNVPVEELGLETIDACAGTAPAGLVAK
eukprot:762560_1